VEFLSSLWDWLGKNSSALQALSGIVFGAAASFIAVLAYRISLRENLGWRPIVVLSGYSLGGGNQKTEMGVEFQVWNRRRYPIVVRDIVVSYRLARFQTVDDGFDPASDAWTVRTPQSIGKDVRVAIAPGKSKHFEMNMVVSGDTMMEDPTIEVSFFDPIANKMRQARNAGGTYLQLKGDYGWWEGLLIYLWPELRREKRYA